MQCLQFILFKNNFVHYRRGHWETFHSVHGVNTSDEQSVDVIGISNDWSAMWTTSSTASIARLADVIVAVRWKLWMLERKRSTMLFICRLQDTLMWSLLEQLRLHCDIFTEKIIVTKRLWRLFWDSRWMILMCLSTSFYSEKNECLQDTLR